jgi:hypothetical protein
MWVIVTLIELASGESWVRATATSPLGDVRGSRVVSQQKSLESYVSKHEGVVHCPLPTDPLVPTPRLRGSARPDPFSKTLLPLLGGWSLVVPC